MNMFMGAAHSPMDRTDAKLKYEDKMARRKYDRARKGKRGGPGHIDDVAIGDEVSDFLCFVSRTITCACALSPTQLQQRALTHVDTVPRTKT